MTDQERLSELELEVKNINIALASHGINSNPHPNIIPSKKKSYGYRPDLSDQRDLLFSSLNISKALPLTVDLRPQDSPVEDQGQLGSCTANALAGALQFLEEKDKIPNVPNMSRLFIYYNERALENTIRSDSGASLRDGIKTLVNQGCCPETEWPYVIARFTMLPPTQCYTDAKLHTVQSYYRLMNVADTKNCLVSGYPFIFGFTVYESFESDAVAATGVVPMPAQNEQVLGGHAVLCVGYEASQNRWIVRNSWGTSWGDKGYFYLPFSYLRYMSDLWCISKAKGL